MDMKYHFIRIFVALSGALAFPLAYHLIDYFLSPEDPNVTFCIAGVLGGNVVMALTMRFIKGRSADMSFK